MGSPIIFKGLEAQLLNQDGILTKDGQLLKNDGQANVIRQSTAIDGVNQWATYADTPGVIPVDGTGGLPAVTWTQDLSITLINSATFKFTKDAANRQGEGVAYPFILLPALHSKPIPITFQTIASAGAVTNDIRCYIYDVDNAVIVTPTVVIVPLSTSPGAFTTSFTPTSGLNFRLILHQASTSTAAYTVNFDKVIVGENASISDQAVTEKKLTGFVSGSGSVSATDSILEAIQKLDGNAGGSGITDLTGDVTATGPGSAVATIAAGAVDNGKIAAGAAIDLNKLAALTPDSAVISDGFGFLTASDTTSTELGYVSGVTSAIQTQLDTKQTAITGNTDSFLFLDGAGLPATINGWNYSTSSLGLNVSLNQAPNNEVANVDIHLTNSFLRPLQDSPDNNYNHLSAHVILDPDSSGFTIGTNGNCANLLNLGFEHNGTSDIGTLGVVSSYSGIGNGTDPINVRGFIGMALYADYNDNVNLTAGLQGFSFNQHVHAGATIATSNAFSNIFSDFANVETANNGWASFISGPNLAIIQNNTNYTGLNVNPTIGTFTGNSGYTGAFIGGALTNLGSSGVTGIQIAPNIDSITFNSKGIGVFGNSVSGTADWVGVDISTSSINTTGAVRGLRVNVNDSDITANNTALDVSGHASLNTQMPLVSSLGQTYGHRIGGDIIVPNGTAITGTTTIANNIGFNISTGDSGSSFTGDGLVDMSAVGFVGQVVGAGTVDTINYCLGGYAAAFTGHIGRISNFAALVANTGSGGTLDESVGFFHSLPFGNPATTAWAFRTDYAGSESYMPRIAIGDMGSKKVVNASVGIELDSTTKAILFSRMSTTQRDALTAVNGMEIYNTTTDTFQVYQAGSWMDSGSSTPVPRSLTNQWLTADGAAKTVTHSWGTRNIRVEVLDNDNDYDTIIVEVSRPTDNTITVTSSEAPGTAWTILISEVLN